MKRILIAAAVALALGGGVAAYEEYELQECFTDSCVFIKCERELGRPCTDEDVFGPVEEVSQESQ